MVFGITFLPFPKDLFLSFSFDVFFKYPWFSCQNYIYGKHVLCLLRVIFLQPLLEWLRTFTCTEKLSPQESPSCTYTGLRGQQSPKEDPQMLTLSFGAAPLRTVQASSGLSLGDSFSTLLFGFVTVAFRLSYC